MRAVYISRGLKSYRLPTLSWLNYFLSKKNISLTIFLEENQSHDILYKKLERQGVKFIYFSNFRLRDVEGFNSRYPNIYFSLSLFYKLFTLKPNFILQEGIGGHGIISLCCYIFFKTKIFVSYERNAFTERNESILKKVYKKTYFNYFAFKIFVPTSLSYEYLVKTLCIPEKKIILQPLCAYFKSRVGIVSFKDKIWEVKKSGILKILFVGQLIERKGIFELLDFIKLLKPSFKKINLYIIGSGELGNFFFDKARDVSFGNCKIIKLGQLNFIQVERVMKMCPFLVLPTKEDNFSLVTLEALNNNVMPFTTKENGAWWQLVKPFQPDFYFDSSNLHFTVQVFLNHYFKFIENSISETFDNSRHITGYSSGLAYYKAFL